MFWACGSINSITIPESVTHMGMRVFNFWKPTQTINIRAAQKPDGWDEDWNGSDGSTVNWGYTGE